MVKGKHDSSTIFGVKDSTHAVFETPIILVATLEEKTWSLLWDGCEIFFVLFVCCAGLDVGHGLCCLGYWVDKETFSERNELAIQVMRGMDATHSSAAGAHENAVGFSPVMPCELHTRHERTVTNSGRTKQGTITFDQVIDMIVAKEVSLG
jgi:hypothetical protein